MTYIKIDMNLITKCNPRDKCKFPSFSSQVNNNNHHDHLHNSNNNNNNKNNATTTTTTASITDDMHFSSVFAYFVYISLISLATAKQNNVIFM